MAVTAAITAVVATSASIYQSEKSASTQREAGRVQNATQQNSDRQALRQRQRETRIRQAQILQAAENSGTSQSSGVAGAFGNLSTQYAATQAFQSGQANAMNGITNLNNQASKQQFQSQVLGQIGNLATSAYTQTPQFQNLFA